MEASRNERDIFVKCVLGLASTRHVLSWVSRIYVIIRELPRRNFGVLGEQTNFSYINETQMTTIVALKVVTRWPGSDTLSLL